MKTYYIAGPMRGYPEFNFPAFDAAAEMLRAQGHYVWSPADLDREKGFDAKGMKGTDEELAELSFDYRSALMDDLCAVSICDHIYMLEGWSYSLGARAEHALARALGLTIEGALA